MPRWRWTYRLRAPFSIQKHSSLDNFFDSYSYFGLIPQSLPEAVERREFIYDRIHQIVYYGNGGYTWSDVRMMPVHIRNYTFNKIHNTIKNQNKDPNIITQDDIQDKNIMKRIPKDVINMKK